MLHYESLRGLKKIAEFSFFYRMSQALISIIAIVIIYQFTNDSEVPIYAYLTSVLVVSILAYLSYRYHLLKHLNPKDSENEDFMSYSKLLSISIPLMFAESVQFIMVWIDKLMLGNMTSVEDVGIYFTAFKLSMIASISLMSINSIASPKFAEKFGKNDINGLRKVVQQSTKMIFWTSFPLVVVFFIIPEYLLSLFGEEFKVGVTAFIFLSCGRLVSSFCGSVGNILKMTNNQNIFGLLLFCGAIINVVLNLVLIPEDNFLSIYGVTGINGAAFASMCSLSFWNLAMVIIVKRKFGFFTFYLPYFKR
jgi:O-antigen/teichoic acid export membrane protein